MGLLFAVPCGSGSRRIKCAAWSNFELLIAQRKLQLQWDGSEPPGHMPMTGVDVGKDWKKLKREDPLRTRWRWKISASFLRLESWSKPLMDSVLTPTKVTDPSTAYAGHWWCSWVNNSSLVQIWWHYLSVWCKTKWQELRVEFLNKWWIGFNFHFNKFQNHTCIEVFRKKLFAFELLNI